ncbi:hypothetical protein NIES2134_120950 [Thermostichus vulcanus NIES-2134]|nr:hypothetical protein NIES2134_120950 [Thermostichus vulcanus NIES-2134]
MKLSRYAAAKVPYGWLFKVSDRPLEVYSEPAKITSRQFSYLSKRSLPTNGLGQLPQLSEQVLELAAVFPSPSNNQRTP